MTLTFGSLFAGIGGFDLGFERAGMSCLWQVEIDDYATRVLERHWPDVRRWRDVKTFPPNPDSCKHECGSVERVSQGPITESCRTDGDWRVDVICGGFPCQDISYAGKGAGLAGERSGLFFEAMRIVRVLGPRYVVLENVAGLLTRGLDKVLGTLASLGYDAEWHCIPAAAVGAPHIRDRVFVIGIRTDSASVRCSQDFDESSNDGQFADTRKGRLQQLGGMGSERKTTENAADTTLPRSKGRRGTEIQRRQVADRHPRACSWWESEPAVGRVAHGIPRRVDRLRGLGNAVVPQVAEWIGRRIVEHAAETREAGETSHTEQGPCP